MLCSLVDFLRFKWLLMLCQMIKTFLLKLRKKNIFMKEEKNVPISMMNTWAKQ